MYIHIKHIYFNMKIKLVERIENYLIIFTRQADGNTAKKKIIKRMENQFNNYFTSIIYYG